MFRRATISRRTFLKGVSLGSSAALLAPILGQLQAHADGGPGQPPRRFIFVVEGNGVRAGHLVPTGVTRPEAPGLGAIPYYTYTDARVFRDVSLEAHDLPDVLAPLAAYKDRLTLLQGLSGRVCQGGHSVNFGALGVYGANRGPAGETIDAALAKALPAPFPHVGLGITNQPTNGVVYNISAWAANQPLPIQCKPDAAHHALFGSVTTAGKDDFAARAHVLDFVAADLKRVESHLAGPEREKLQTYAHALEQMRLRHDKVKEREADLAKLAPVVGPKFASETETDRLEAHVEIGAAALVAGLTNVLVLASGCGGPYFEVTFRGLGINVHKHHIGHGLGENGKTGDELARTIRRYHMGLVARLADRLKAVPEGTGTMLDNTVIVYLSDSADAHHATCYEWPILILGNLGGKLKTQGRYIEFPRYGRAGHRTIANLYCTFLHAAGAPRDKFGVLDPELPAATQTGPLAELLA
jgi:hypothetical protein